MTQHTQEVGTADISSAARTLAEGFADDPLLQWIFPDPGTHLDYSVRYFTHQATAAAKHGQLLADLDHVGAAVWLPSDQWQRLEADAAHEAALRAACGPHAARAVTYDHATAHRHPVDRPHWYLGYIGVRPAHRSHGVGSALLRHILDTCDREGLGAYLEASSRRSARLYGRHGFELMGPGIQLPDGGPEMLPMWRNPAPRR